MLMSKINLVMQVVLIRKAKKWGYGNHFFIQLLNLLFFFFFFFLASSLVPSPGDDSRADDLKIKFPLCVICTDAIEN